MQLKQEQKKTTVEQIEFAGRIIVLAIGMLLMSRNLGNMFIGTREDNSAAGKVAAAVQAGKISSRQ